MAADSSDWNSASDWIGRGVMLAAVGGVVLLVKAVRGPRFRAWSQRTGHTPAGIAVAASQVFIWGTVAVFAVKDWFFDDDTPSDRPAPLYDSDGDEIFIDPAEVDQYPSLGLRALRA